MSVAQTHRDVLSLLFQYWQNHLDFAQAEKKVWTWVIRTHLLTHTINSLSGGKEGWEDLEQFSKLLFANCFLCLHKHPPHSAPPGSYINHELRLRRRLFSICLYDLEAAHAQQPLYCDNTRRKKKKDFEISCCFNLLQHLHMRGS